MKGVFFRGWKLLCFWGYFSYPRILFLLPTYNGTYNTMGMDGVPRFSEAFPPRDFSCPLFGVSIVWKAFFPGVEHYHIIIPPEDIYFVFPGILAQK